jgi:hypothetical protein
LRSKISRATRRGTITDKAALGEEYKHWFRAKFLQQFRLFFRYQQTEGAKIIVLAWVNDDSTLRAYESANDTYAVFRKMMKRGKPSLANYSTREKPAGPEGTQGSLLDISHKSPDGPQADHFRGVGRAKRLSSARSLTRRVPAFYAGYLAHRTFWPGMTTVSADDRPIRLRPAIWKKRPLRQKRPIRNGIG